MKAKALSFVLLLPVTSQVWCWNLPIHVLVFLLPLRKTARRMEFW